MFHCYVLLNEDKVMKGFEQEYAEVRVINVIITAFAFVLFKEWLQPLSCR